MGAAPPLSALTDEQLDRMIAAPGFADRSDAVAVLAEGYGRQRAARKRVLRRISIGYGILTLSVVLALLGVQHIQTTQNHDQSRRTEDQAVAAARAVHDQAVVNYNACVFVNTHVIDPISEGIDALTAPTPTTGVTDPATLTRIKNSNLGKAAARAAFGNLADVPCGPKP